MGCPRSKQEDGQGLQGLLRVPDSGLLGPLVWGAALGRRRGSKVEMPWDLGIEPVRGSMMVVMGAPSAGKSLFALNWCLRVAEPSVLVSLDTTMSDQAVRACSILAGVPKKHVEESPEAWGQYLDRKNLNCRLYDLNVTPKDINDLVLAEEEYWGRAPAIVVVDNLVNVVRDTSYEAYRSTFLELQKVARLRECVVVVLHHVKRDSATGPLSLHSGQYSGEQEAEVVLGLWRSLRGLEVGVLKNRNGLAAPDGSMSVPLNLDITTMRIEPRTERMGLPYAS